MKGAIENCCRAEQEIMKKVREAYENDVAAMSVSAGCLCLPFCEPEPWQKWVASEVGVHRLGEGPRSFFFLKQAVC